jgi:hypothetical protein
VGEVEVPGAELEHLDQARLVEHGSVSGGQTRLVTPPATAAASSDSSRPGVLVARLAEARRQVDEARCDDRAARVDRPRRVEVAQPRRAAVAAADDGDPAAVDGRRCRLVAAARRVDQPGVADQDALAHRRSVKRCCRR